MTGHQQESPILRAARAVEAAGKSGMPIREAKLRHAAAMLLWRGRSAASPAPAPAEDCDTQGHQQERESER